MILNEVHTISLSECSVELDTGAGCDDTLLVLFSLLAVGTLEHGEAAATGLRVHTRTHTHTYPQRKTLDDVPNLLTESKRLEQGQARTQLKQR